MASQTDPLEADASLQLGLVDVMAAIASCQAALTAKIKAAQLEVSLLRQDNDKFRSRMTEVEQRVGQTEDTVMDHGIDIRSLRTRLKALEYRAKNPKKKEVEE